MVRILVIVAAWVVGGAAASADVLVLKDGRSLEGEVVEETGSSVVFRHKVANVATVETFPRFRIAALERRALPEGFFDDRKAAPKPEDEPETDAPGGGEEPAALAVDAVGYAVVPIEGTVGEEISAHALKRVLEAVEKRRVTHVVFVVDSPGGYVYEATQLLDVLKAHDEGLTYHTFIRGGAISAASVFAAGADHIYVSPDATLGGALAYSTGAGTGAMEVDAKFNSIWASALAARAESKGHSGEAFRAMAEQAAELWITSEGAFSATRPTSGEQIDGRTTILTLRSSQMQRAGMARPIAGPAEIGPLHGLEGWAEVPRIADRIVQAEARTRQRLTDRHAALHRDLELAMEAAVKADPASGRYYVNRDTGRFTSGSMAQWQQACDGAQGRWNDVRKVLVALSELDKDAAKVGALHLVTDPDEGNRLYRLVDERMDWIAKNRGRMSPP